MAIYVFSPDESTPMGGVKKLYRHVEALRKLGHEAWLVHFRKGFQCAWFTHKCPLAYIDFDPAVLGQGTEVRTFTLHINGRSKAIDRQDVMVLPETFAPYFVNWAPGVPKVVFNQNAYLTFANFPALVESSKVPSQSNSAYKHPDLKAILAVSEDNMAYLEYAFPGIPLFRVHNSINPDLFYFSEHKKSQIALMPRKNAHDIRQVYQILMHRNSIPEWTWIAIDGKKEAEVAECLRQSLVFLSFGFPEGFSLPPAEAMACGCLAIGYHGNAGREFMRPEFSYPVDAIDIMGFCKAVETVAGEWRKSPQALLNKARSGAEYIRTHYSPELEEDDIRRAWEKILL